MTSSPVGGLGFMVIGHLGSGATGQVLLVEHPRLPRRDAVKVISAALSRDDLFRARFDRETRLLSRITHPNIVRVYDRGETDGLLWMSMEYVAGGDASSVVRSAGPIALAAVVAIITDIAAALDYMYRHHRVTHRDVKPSNILICRDASGAVAAAKLTDFGTAKMLDESTTITATGRTVGTLSYMAPEVIEGHEYDNRADVYSLGCTAFELLTGECPYPADTLTAQVAAHLRAPAPSARARNSALPARADDVLARALAKRPEHRYLSCADFADALADLSRPRVEGYVADISADEASDRVRATAPPRIRTRRTARLVISAACLALMAAGAATADRLANEHDAQPGVTQAAVQAAALSYVEAFDDGDRARVESLSCPAMQRRYRVSSSRYRSTPPPQQQITIDDFERIDIRLPTALAFVRLHHDAPSTVTNSVIMLARKKTGLWRVCSVGPQK